MVTFLVIDCCTKQRNNPIKCSFHRLQVYLPDNMVKAKVFVVKKHFKGSPKRTDYEIAEHELPPLNDGDILVKADFISVDPYQLVYNKGHEVPFEQFGFQVASVVESKHAEYPVGTNVVSHKGWRDFTILTPDNNKDAKDQRERIRKLPDMQGLSYSLGVGAIGMPGATAYFGLLEICKAKAGETLVVTGAAGAVGSLVGQIAKIKGLRVIGFAGSERKVQWLEKELGFDKAFNYKTVNVAAALKESAPNGVDCYYDNVGGDISSTIISHMNIRGRVAVCGSISSYSEDPNQLPQTIILQPAILTKQLTIQGFWTWCYSERWEEAFTELIPWIKSGQLKAEEHVTEGFENLYEAFTGMLAGDNTGKAVVKVQ